jgi:hypothetical protein
VDLDGRGADDDRLQDREVLEAVGSDVGVAGVVRRRAVSLVVEAERLVVVDRVSADGDPAGGLPTRYPALNATTLPSPGPVPPILMPPTFDPVMIPVMFPTGSVPLASVPTRFPRTLVSPASL